MTVRLIRAEPIIGLAHAKAQVDDQEMPRITDLLVCIGEMCATAVARRWTGSWTNDIRPRRPASRQFSVIGDRA